MIEIGPVLLGFLTEILHTLALCFLAWLAYKFFTS